MSEQTTNKPDTEQDVQMSETEIKKIREEATAYYTEEIQFLKVQEEYERLVADIEEHRFRRLNSMMRYAQLNAAMNGSLNPEEPNQEGEPQREAPTKERKLATS